MFPATLAAPGSTLGFLAAAPGTSAGAPGTPGIAGISGLLACLPFPLLLAAIAVMPFICRHWWERRYPIVTAALALLIAAYYALLRASLAPLIHEVEEYLGFIILLAALYTVSGGIILHIHRRPSPALNTAVLFIGALLSNILGTTGAAMLLIRPYLRLNHDHLRPYHCIFFIFIVANTGGCLTPIGDPPLFLGYLTGVPFWWPLQHCALPWLVINGFLLLIFFLLDTADARRHPRPFPAAPLPVSPVRILGVHNLVLVLLVVAAVFRPGIFALTAISGGGAGGAAHGALALAWGMLTSREVLMIALSLASLLLTSRHIHRTNEFAWGPILEVAILFAGIFITMAPIMEYLAAQARTLPITAPGHYYFATGLFSTILDNTPTYALFLQMKLAQLAAVIAPATAPVAAPGIGQSAQTIAAMLRGHCSLGPALAAISCGAVFFGAGTYIGNGPNLMVKSLVESGGHKMPGFFGYIARYALPILTPPLLLVWWLFFR
jgi:Na+/H+ antiporter NhaD/arsenite permease-like protein